MGKKTVGIDCGMARFQDVLQNAAKEKFDFFSGQLRNCK
jgi:hypothetical protein